MPISATAEASIRDRRLLLVRRLWGRHRSAQPPERGPQGLRRRSGDQRKRVTSVQRRGDRRRSRPGGRHRRGRADLGLGHGDRLELQPRPAAPDSRPGPAGRAPTARRLQLDVQLDDPCSDRPGVYGAFDFKDTTDCELAPGSPHCGEWKLAGTERLAGTGVTRFFPCGTPVAGDRVPVDLRPWRLPRRRRPLQRPAAVDHRQRRSRRSPAPSTLPPRRCATTATSALRPRRSSTRH